MSEYVRYGDEWCKEVMKNPKRLIVEMLRNVALERDKLYAAQQSVQRTADPARAMQEFGEAAQKVIDEIIEERRR